MTRRLFVGFSSIDAKGSNKIYDIKLVNRDLLNAFYTRKGERRMLPEFGSIIWNLLFEPFTADIRDQILEDAENIIAGDTRVRLLSSNVTEYQNGIVVELQLSYEPYGVVNSFKVDFDKRAATGNY